MNAFTISGTYHLIMARTQVVIVGGGLQIWRVAANTVSPRLSYTIRPENVYEG